MRNHIRKSVFAVSLVAVLSMTVPAMAAPREAKVPRDLFTRIKQVIAHVLDVVIPDPPPPGFKMTTPPG